MTRRWVTLPRSLNLALIAVGGLLVGGKAAASVAAPQAETIVEQHVHTTTEMRVVTRRVKGHIRVLAGGEKVIHVPLIVVRTDTKVVRIPAHDIPISTIKGARAAFKAKPNEPVTVTVYQPVPVASPPETVTTTVDHPPVTLTDTVTVTVSLPDPTNNPTTGGTG
jgi:hypothetical protein